jgi:hypothetical protein
MRDTGDMRNGEAKIIPGVAPVGIISRLGFSAPTKTVILTLQQNKRQYDNTHSQVTCRPVGPI